MNESWYYYLIHDWEKFLSIYPMSWLTEDCVCASSLFRSEDRAIETCLPALSLWAHDAPWLWHVLSPHTHSCWWFLVFPLGFMFLNKSFRSSWTIGTPFSLVFPSLLTLRQWVVSSRLSPWNSELGTQNLFAAEMEKTFSLSVSAQYELCIHPALIWIKSLPAVKFFDFFSMVFRSLEILILNLFSNIKFLVKVKDRIPLFWYPTWLCGINIDSRMKERSKACLRTPGQQMGIERMSVHLQNTKLVTGWSLPTLS